MLNDGHVTGTKTSNFKHQTSKKAPNIKLQAKERATHVEFPHLKFDASLKFGV
jgi:hypothetical protein